jgi:Amidohydrolase family
VDVRHLVVISEMTHSVKQIGDEYFVQRYGQKAAERTPPYKRLMDMGVQVGVGTDATRVASYDPWNALYWLVSGKTLGGHQLYPAANLVDRETALRLYTQANTWFSNEEGVKGQIKVGQLADLAILSADYFSVPEEDIRQIVSSLTMVGGKIVYAANDFASYDMPLPPAMPDWSPVRSYSGYYKSVAGQAHAGQKLNPQAFANCGCGSACGIHGHAHGNASNAPTGDTNGFWGALGCSCWAV